MLYDIFKSNKLEYVHINSFNGHDIVKSATLQHNIENIRYLYVYNNGNRIDITLDIFYEYPMKL